MTDLFDIAKNFKFEGRFLESAPFGMGHINDTYALNFDKDGTEIKYILQRINRNVFPDIEGLMSNIISVTQYLKEKVENDGGDAGRECLKFVETADEEGKFYIEDESGAWRAYRMIEDAEAYQIAENPEMFQDAGRAFGKFISRLSDFPAKELVEVIPDFHNTKARFKNFEKALDRDFENRSCNVKNEINFVLDRKGYCPKIVEMLKLGDIPWRVTHNDTKLNNVLFDVNTKRAVCVIDLDTIMPGSLLYDFGDAVRSGCTTALEDEKDLKKVGFDFNLFSHLTKGFLDGIGDNITETERDLLAFGGILMTYECGMRFLTDYLSGDVYFKVAYPEHNLVRARTQFKLVSDMEKQLTKMNKAVLKYSKV